MQRKGDRDEREWREPGYGAYGSGYGSPGHIDQRGNRNWVDKTGDEVASWFGDEHAQQRRRWDHVRERERARYERRGDYDEDAELRREIEHRLDQDEFFDAAEIHVSVHANEATLEGVVNYAEEAREAERVARRVPGVIYVNNEIRVRSRVERATIGMGYDSTPPHGE
ncbi:MAG TPA: BON domain-containing protein [Caulobacterales bacterium]|nr:BON domain-containing protein [Caulobacterales bacterium]